MLKIYYIIIYCAKYCKHIRENMHIKRLFFAPTSPRAVGDGASTSHRKTISFLQTSPRAVGDGASTSRRKTISSARMILFWFFDTSSVSAAMYAQTIYLHTADPPSPAGEGSCSCKQKNGQKKGSLREGAVERSETEGECEMMFLAFTLYHAGSFRLFASQKSTSLSEGGKKRADIESALLYSIYFFRPRYIASVPTLQRFFRPSLWLSILFSFIAISPFGHSFS